MMSIYGENEVVKDEFEVSHHFSFISKHYSHSTSPDDCKVEGKEFV